MQTKSGKPLHPIGIGTWLIAGAYEFDEHDKYRGAKPNKGNEPAEIEAIRYSIAKGQNHLDCAEMYGGFYTDEVVGQALERATREDVYIADKLWKTSVGKGLVRPTVEQMLRKLGTDYLDMLYIHAPWFDAPWQEAIPQIDELIDEGIVRDFGVSNFTVEKMTQAQALAKHPIVANQMNYNVLHKSEVGTEFKQYCNENNIRIVAYQPVKRKEVLANETIQAIAAAHQATAAQIALSWLIAQGALPIPKAMSRQHIDENIAAVDITLSNEELGQLSAITEETQQ